MKKLRKAVGFIVVVISIFYFIRTVLAHKQSILDIQSYISIWLIFPVFLFSLAVITSGIFWGQLASRLLKLPIKKVEAVRVQCLSWILKYVPGQMGSYMNKLNWAIEKKYDKIAVSSSFIYENLFLVSSSFVLSVPVLLIYDKTTFDLIFGVSVVVIIGLIFYLYRSSKSRLFHILNELSKKLFGRSLNEHFFLSKSELLKFNTQYLIPRALNGIGFVFVVVTLVPVHSWSFIQLGSLYILSGVIGLLAFLVPSGIGVREAVIIYFSSMLMPQEVAVVISILARFCALAADLIVLMIFIILKLIYQ